MRIMQSFLILFVSFLVLSVVAACGGDSEDEPATATPGTATGSTSSSLSSPTPTEEVEPGASATPDAPGPTEAPATAPPAATDTPPPTQATAQEVGRVLKLDKSNGKVGARPAQDNVAIFSGELIETDNEGRLRVAVGPKVKECRMRELTQLQAMPAAGIHMVLEQGEMICVTNDARAPFVAQVDSEGVGPVIIRADDPLFGVSIDPDDGTITLKVTSGEIEVEVAPGDVRTIVAGRSLSIFPGGGAGEGDVGFEGSEEESIYEDIASEAGITPTAFRALVRFNEDDQSFDPDLAQDWNFNAERTEAVFDIGSFRLSPGGQPVTSETVQELLEDSPVVQMPGFDAIETPDEFTLIVRWQDPQQADAILDAISEVKVGVLIH